MKLILSFIFTTIIKTYKLATFMTPDKTMYLDIDDTSKLKLFPISDLEVQFKITPLDYRYHIKKEDIKICHRKDNSVGDCKKGKQKTSEWMFCKNNKYYTIYTQDRKQTEDPKCMTVSNNEIIMAKCDNLFSQMFYIEPDLIATDDEKEENLMFPPSPYEDEFEENTPKLPGQIQPKKSSKPKARPAPATNYTNMIKSWYM